MSFVVLFFFAIKSSRSNVVPRYQWSNVMNEQELNNHVEANDFVDELSDEVLDRAENTLCQNGQCNTSWS